MTLIDGLSSIGDAIREKTGTSDLIPFEDMPQAIRDIQSGGDTEELETLIDESGVLDSTEGSVTDKVEQLIEKAETEKHIYEASLLKDNAQHEFEYWRGKKLPKTNFVKSSYFNFFASESDIETVDYYLDWIRGGQLTSAFQNTPKLKTMVGVNTANATTVASMFNKSGIVSIQEPFDFSKIANASSTSAFTTANSLVEVRFKTETIKWSIKFASAVLSAESIQSIAYGLAYVTTAQTLTLPKVFENDFEKLPAELRDLITNQKGWTLGFA